MRSASVSRSVNFGGSDSRKPNENVRQEISSSGGIDLQMDLVMKKISMMENKVRKLERENLELIKLSRTGHSNSEDSSLQRETEQKIRAMENNLYSLKSNLDIIQNNYELNDAVSTNTLLSRSLKGKSMDDIIAAKVQNEVNKQMEQALKVLTKQFNNSDSVYNNGASRSFNGNASMNGSSRQDGDVLHLVQNEVIKVVSEVDRLKLRQTKLEGMYTDYRDGSSVQNLEVTEHCKKAVDTMRREYDHQFNMVQNTIAEINTALLSLRRNQSQSDVTIDALEIHAKQTDDGLTQLNSQIEELTAKLEETQKSVADTKTHCTFTDNKVQVIESQLDNILNNSIKYKALSDKIDAQGSDLSVLDSVLSALSGQVQHMESETLSARNTQEQRLHETFTEMDHKIEIKTGALTQTVKEQQKFLKSLRQDFDASVNENETKVQELVAKVGTVDKTHAAIEAVLAEMDTRSNADASYTYSINTALQRLDIRMNSVESDVTHVKNNTEHTVKANVKSTMDTVYRELTALETRLHSDVTRVGSELSQLRDEVGTDLAQHREEMLSMVSAGDETVFDHVTQQIDDQLQSLHSDLAETLNKSVSESASQLSAKLTALREEVMTAMATEISRSAVETGAAVEARMAAIKDNTESTVAEVESRVESRLTELCGTLTALRGEVDKAEEALIATVDGRIESLSGRIADITGPLSDRLGGLTTEVCELKQQQQQLQQEQEALQNMAQQPSTVQPHPSTSPATIVSSKSTTVSTPSPTAAAAAAAIPSTGYGSDSGDNSADDADNVDLLNLMAYASRLGAMDLSQYMAAAAAATTNQESGGGDVVTGGSSQPSLNPFDALLPTTDDDAPKTATAVEVVNLDSRHTSIAHSSENSSDGDGDDDDDSSDGSSGSSSSSSSSTSSDDDDRGFDEKKARHPATAIATNTATNSAVFHPFSPSADVRASLAGGGAETPVDSPTPSVLSSALLGGMVLLSSSFYKSGAQQTAKTQSQTQTQTVKQGGTQTVVSPMTSGTVTASSSTFPSWHDSTARTTVEVTQGSPTGTNTSDISQKRRKRSRGSSSNRGSRRSSSPSKSSPAKSGRDDFVEALPTFEYDGEGENEGENEGVAEEVSSSPDPVVALEAAQEPVFSTQFMHGQASDQGDNQTSLRLLSDLANLSDHHQEQQQHALEVSQSRQFEARDPVEKHGVVSVNNKNRHSAIDSDSGSDSTNSTVSSSDSDSDSDLDSDGCEVSSLSAFNRTIDAANTDIQALNLHLLKVESHHSLHQLDHTAAAEGKDKTQTHTQSVIQGGIDATLSSSKGGDGDENNDLSASGGQRSTGPHPYAYPSASEDSVTHRASPPEFSAAVEAELTSVSSLLLRQYRHVRPTATVTEPGQRMAERQHQHGQDITLNLDFDHSSRDHSQSDNDHHGDDDEEDDRYHREHHGQDEDQVFGTGIYGDDDGDVYLTATAMATAGGNENHHSNDHLNLGDDNDEGYDDQELDSTEYRAIERHNAIMSLQLKKRRHRAAFKLRVERPRDDEV